MREATLDEALRLIGANRAEGVELLRQIAARGDPEGLFILADLFWTGNMVPQNPPHGRLLFEYAAAHGHPEANLLVTNLLASGVAGRRNWPAALARLEAEARVLPERQACTDLIAAMEIDANGDPRIPNTDRSVSEQPRAWIFDELLTPAECDHLIKVADPGFEPSMVYDDERRLVRDTIRTSDGSALHWLIEDPAIHALNRRIAAATRTAYEDGEPLQVLRYSDAQEYRPHFDWVDKASNQRIWTALIYLNEDYEGGETAFVRTGTKVRGRKGDALVFSNALESGDGDPLAEHAGLPVTRGIKYLATRWIREARWIP